MVATTARKRLKRNTAAFFILMPHRAGYDGPGGRARDPGKAPFIRVARGKG